MVLKSEAAARKDANSGLYRADMQHRHFAVIASIISDFQPGLRDAIAYHFATELARTNPKFDRARFIAACNARKES